MLCNKVLHTFSFVGINFWIGTAIADRNHDSFTTKVMKMLTSSGFEVTDCSVSFLLRTSSPFYITVLHPMCALGAHFKV